MPDIDISWFSTKYLAKQYFYYKGVTESEKTELEAKMKSINRAYKVLNDTYNRRTYDAGLEYDDIDVDDFFDSDTRWWYILLFQSFQ